MNGNDIKDLIKLIDEKGNDNPNLNHIKNVLLNRRSGKSYTKAQLIEIIKQYKPEYDLDTLKNMDDKKLYNLIIKLELEVINYGI